jgi:hypothetical protein
MNYMFRILLSGLLILAMASPAAGAFEKNHLIQVVYNENDNEVGVDLGDLSTIDFAEEDVLLGQAGSVTLDRFPTVSHWSDLSLGYFAYDDGTYENWFATIQSSAPTVSTGGFSTFQNQALQVQTHYGSNEVSPGIAVASSGALRSYDQLMNDGSAAPGNYAGFNTDWQDGESLLGLLSSQGYVDMYLFHFDVVTLNKGPDPKTDYTGFLRIMADGSTILNPSNGQNEAPVANDDGATTGEGLPVSINVIANDTDGDGAIDPASVTITSGPSNGGADPESDGTVTYTPDAGFAGTDTFTYTVVDDGGATSNEATVTVTVTAGNQPPVANDDGATTEEETPVHVDVLANDTDADGMVDATTLTITNQPTNGTALDNGDGTVTYTPNAGFTGADTFTYTVEDDDRAVSNEATVSVTVVSQGTISAPSVNYPPDQEEVDALRPTLSVNNATVSGGVVLTYEFEVSSDPELLTLVTSVTGVAEGDETTSWGLDVDLVENISYYWRSRATDGAEFSPWMDIATFFVNTANEAPTVPNVSQPADNSDVDTQRPVLGVTNAADPDLDPLTYEFEVYEADMTTLRISKMGVLEGDGTTTWQVDEDLGDNSAYWWRARARDDEDLAGDWTDLVPFFVDLTNDAPSPPLVISPQDGDTVDTVAPVLEVGNATDLDQDVLTYFFEIDQLNTFDSAFLEQSGEVSEGAGGTTSWEPSQLEDNTTHYWRAKAWDGAADSPWSTTAAFFVDLSNDAPQAVDDEGTTTQDNPITIDLIVNDVDVDGLIEPATVAVVMDATNGTVQENGDGTVTYIPEAGFLGEDIFTYTVEDDDGALSNEANVAVLVNDEPSAPTLNSPANDMVVNTPRPTLSVNNASDSDALTYIFEVYSDEDLLAETLVATATVEEGEDGVTSWTVSESVTKGQTYYWRCQADDGYTSSSWMETARFSVGDLSLVLVVPAQAGEGAGVVQGAVSIPEVLSQDLEVSLECDDASEVTVPALVTILSGETSVTFDLTVIDDSDHDGTQSVTLFAFATGWTVGTAEIAIGDNERSGSRGSSGCFVSAAGEASSLEWAHREGPFSLLPGMALIFSLSAGGLVMSAKRKRHAETLGCGS